MRSTTRCRPAPIQSTGLSSIKARMNRTSSPASGSAGAHPSLKVMVWFFTRGRCRCDERFAGYGGNKAACLFEMYLSGVSFYVLSDHFLIHQSHKYEEEARREEVDLSHRYFALGTADLPSFQRKSNRKLYADFKEESCLRYLPISISSPLSPCSS